MDEWFKFTETTFPEKYNFYSERNITNITDLDYNYAKRVCKEFFFKNWVSTMTFMLKVVHYYWLMFL